MTREDFDKKFGHTFFIKHNKWGTQLTNDEAAKVAGTSVTAPAAAATRVAPRSTISINNKK